MFYDLVEFIWKEATVKLKVAELLEGEPDGCIGLPLVIDESSKVFEVTLSNVYEFKSVSEPFFHLDGKRQKINDFVWEVIGSEYRKTAGFYGSKPETARHFIVFTETLVFEALSDTEPVITLIPK
jgi:hypothetical protein